MRQRQPDVWSVAAGTRPPPIGAAVERRRRIVLQLQLRLAITTVAVAGLWVSGAAPDRRWLVTALVLGAYQPAAVAVAWLRRRQDHPALDRATVAVDVVGGLVAALLVPELRLSLELLLLVMVVTETVSHGRRWGLATAALSVAAATLAELAAPTRDPQAVAALVAFVGAAGGLPLIVDQLSREHRTQAAHLGRLHRALSSIRPANGAPLATLDAVAEAARAAVGAELVEVTAWLEAGDAAVHHGRSGDPPTDDPRARWSDEVARTGDTLRAVDGSQEIVAVPLRAGEGVIGALVAYLPARVDEPTTVVELLEAYAEGASLLVLRSVSEHREQQRNEELRRSEARQEEFVSGLAHDLRIPLTTVRGFLETILRRGEGLPSADRLRMLEIARRNADELDRRIRTILEYARVGGGQLQLRPLVRGADELVAAALDLSQGLLVRHRVLLEVDHDVDVLADPDAVSHVLTNLVANATKYAPRGTTITLAVHDRGEHVEFSVSDEGVGIPVPDRERVFERFARGPSAGVVEGTGLGLALARAYVELSDGRIWVTDSPGGGARIAFTLPRAGRRATHASV